MSSTTECGAKKTEKSSGAIQLYTRRAANPKQSPRSRSDPSDSDHPEDSQRMGNCCCCCAVSDKDERIIQLSKAHKTLFESDCDLRRDMKRYLTDDDKYRAIPPTYRKQDLSSQNIVGCCDDERDYFTVDFAKLREDIRVCKVKANYQGLWTDELIREWDKYVDPRPIDCSNMHEHRCLFNSDGTILNINKIKAVIRVEKEQPEPSAETRVAYHNLIHDIMSLPRVCFCGTCVGCRLQVESNQIIGMRAYTRGAYVMYPMESLQYELAVRKAHQANLNDQHLLPTLRGELRAFQNYGLYPQKDVEKMTLQQLQAAVDEAIRRRDLLAATPLPQI